jgi:hypothetical protein
MYLVDAKLTSVALLGAPFAWPEPDARTIFQGDCISECHDAVNCNC